MDGLDHLLVLDERGLDPPVGEEEPVEAEAAAVGVLAEVAAVGEALGAVLRLPADAVVGPLPDEASGKARVGVHRLPVLLEVARRVPHGVAVLAHQERAGVVFLPLLDQSLQPRVHGAHDVDDGRVFRPLVMDGPGGIGLSHPPGHGVVVGPVSRLVPQGPDDHGGVVLVALHHAPHPVDVGVLPLGPVGQVRLVAHEDEAVGFQVGLVDHVQAVAVAQVEPARVVGVVGAADGVDIVPLHQEDVPLHRLPRDDEAQVGVELVAVHPLDHHGPAVDEEPAALDPYRAEAHVHPLHLEELAAALEREEQRVKEGRLRAPLPGRANRRRPVELHLLPRRGRGRRGELLLEHPFPTGAQEGGPHPPLCRVVAVIAHEGPHFQHGVLVRVAEVGADAHVADVELRRSQEVHVAEDAAHAPLVLVLEVAPHRPLVHLHRNEVLARSQIARHVELGAQVAPLAVPDLLAVDPDVEGRIDALEDEEDLAGAPLLGEFEAAPVNSGRVLRRDVRGVDREGVLAARVVGNPVAVELPVAGDGDQVPPGVVRFLPARVAGEARYARSVEETPESVQQHEVRRGAPLPGECLLRVGVGDKGGPRRFHVPA